jgi:electron transfer flavoprotein alpha subunit
MIMSGNVWVLAEHWRGEVADITYEVLALGREVANALGVKLEAVLMGSGHAGMAATLGKADAVLYADHPSLVEPMHETYTEALVQLACERKPRAILVPLTNVNLGVGTVLASRLSGACINFCKDVRVTGGVIQASALLYGGKMEALVAARSEPAVLGIWPGARSPDQGRADAAPPVEQVTVTLPDAPRVRFRRYIDPDAGGVDITQQDALVAVGRGIQSKDNLELAEELALELGGAVCGSRPVIDQGWLPLTRQVGKSGASVKPKVYLAAGISGAPEHIEGIRGAGLVVAVNTDAQAPIFGVAHYGVVADALDFIPALIEAVRKKKQGSQGNA